MHHRLSGKPTYRLKGQCAGDEYPTYAPLEYCPPYCTLFETLQLEYGPLYLNLMSWPSVI